MELDGGICRGLHFCQFDRISLNTYSDAIYMTNFDENPGSRRLFIYVSRAEQLLIPCHQKHKTKWVHFTLILYNILDDD